jgi:excisionase family DNA binding protein
MAGMFYSLQEAAEKLNLTEDQLKEFVQEGKLREFRDGPNLLFKVDEVEALIPEFGAAEPEAPSFEVTEPEVPEPAMPALEAEEEEAVVIGATEGELDVPEPEAEEGTAIELEVPELQAEEGTEVELEVPEPEAEAPEAVELEAPEPEALEAEMPEPEAEISEPEVLGTPDGEPEEEISELEALSEEEIPSLEDIEAEMDEVQEPTAEEPAAEEVIPETPAAEAPEPEVPKPSESAEDSEILLAPETGAPLMSNDLTDADTALTGLGTNVLGETDQDYAITDDTMAETAVPMGTGGTTPEVPLEEIEGDVNLDTFGSGSGLLDLSLQADDTSLGGILDEIYTAEDEGGKELGEAEGDSEMAVAAEADQMISEEEITAPQAAPEMAAIARPMIEVAPDSQSNTLGMLLFLPLVIVIYTTVVAIAGQRDVMPSILGSIQAFIWYIMGGAAVVAALVVVAAFMFTGERSAAPKAKKEKKPKAKKEKVKKEKKAKKPKEPKKPKEKKPKKPKKPKKAKKGFLRFK